MPAAGLRGLESMLLSTIDLLPPEQRDAFLVDALRNQLNFMCVVVTRLSGADERGERLPNTGTQIFRLAIGDSATWITDPCACGLTTPRVRDVQRHKR